MMFLFFLVGVCGCGFVCFLMFTLGKVGTRNLWMGVAFENSTGRKTIVSGQATYTLHITDQYKHFYGHKLGYI